MDRISLQVEIWRLVSKHTRLVDALPAIRDRLRSFIPMDGILIRHLDPGRGRIETLGEDWATPPDNLAGLQSVPPQAIQSIHHWILTQQPADGDHLPEHALPAGLMGPKLAFPLVTERGALGFVILSGPVGESQSPTMERELLTILCDPLAAAMDHDLHERELHALREKVEADNQSLLARLGRSDIADTIVGADRGLALVMQRVAQVAKSDAAVLILGETGSGKEVVARAIHNRSRRHAGPFLRVNCGAIPTELIDSELFGHEKGSFTGAVSTREGWFERADGGTLFLDECGELPLAAQVRLLRILQDGSFQKVGGEKTLHVDVRIITATHRDLQTMVRDGTFRQDLWYRIAVFPVQLPPLRERPADIADLAAHFAKKSCKKLGLPMLTPSRENIAMLERYHWPGNVRELAAVIERAAILGEGRFLDVETALGGWNRPPLVIPSSLDAATGLVSPNPTAANPTFQTLDEAMAAHILKALERSLGRIEGPFGAAKLLKINPHTLRARMRKLKIDWAQYRPGTESG